MPRALCLVPCAVAQGRATLPTANYQLPTTNSCSVRLYVSPDGDDAAAGSEAAPLRTPAGARQAVANMRAGSQRRDPVEVIFEDGTYPVTSKISFSASDGGMTNAPVVWRARNRGKAVFSAAIDLAWSPLQDEAVLALLPAAARSHVQVAQIPGTAALPTFFGGAQYAGSVKDVPIDLFDGEERLVCARYPNEGLAEVATVDDDEAAYSGSDRNTNTVYATYAEDKLAEWQAEPFPWVWSIWSKEWAEAKHRLTVQPATTGSYRVIAIPPEAAPFGLVDHGKFYAFNCFCELDCPGEWVVDLDRRLVYLWPAGDGAPSTATLALSDGFVSAKQLTDFTFDGIVFEKCRKTAIALGSGCARVSIRGCTVRHTCSWGVTTSGTTACRVEGCDLYDLGEGGVRLDGGEHKTLTYGGNVADNNHIHHFGRLLYDYMQAVSLRGTGNVCTHNLIHHSNHTAIQTVGNDHTIGWNVVHDTCEYNDDAGAIYVYNYSWVRRGGTIEHNYVLRTGKKCNSARNEGIYLDDYSSEATVRNNVVNGATRGLLIGGGQSNEIYGNAMLNCDLSMTIGTRYSWANSQKGRKSSNFIELDSDYETYTSPFWLGHYPGLARLIEVEDPVFAHHAFWNVVTNNVSWHTGAATKSYWNIISNTTVWADNIQFSDDDPCPAVEFPSPDTPNSPGLYDSPCRASPAVAFGEPMLPAPQNAPSKTKPSVSFRISFSADAAGFANCTKYDVKESKSDARSLRHEIYVPPSSTIQTERHAFAFVPQKTEDLALSIVPAADAVEICDLVIGDASYPIPVTNEQLAQNTYPISAVSNQPVTVAYSIRRTEGFSVAAGETMTLTADDVANLANIKEVTVEAGGILVFDIAANTSVTFAPKIVGAGSVRVTGAGMIAFSAENAFTGGFELAGAGRAAALNACSFGATNVPVVVSASNAILVFHDYASFSDPAARHPEHSVYCNPIDIRATNGVVYLQFCFTNAYSAIDFHGSIDSVAASTYLMGNRKEWCGDGQRVVNLYGAVNAPGRMFGKFNLDYLVFELITVNCYGKVTCAQFEQDAKWWGRGYFHFYNANAIGELSPSISTFHANAENAWAGATLTANRNRTGYHSSTTLDFHGHSMTIAGFKSYDCSLTGSNLEILCSSDAPVTLTVTNGILPSVTTPRSKLNIPHFQHLQDLPITIARLNEGISLVWAPENCGTGIFYNCTHLTSGSISVAKGTFATEGAVRFPNLSAIDIAADAAFDFNTTATNDVMPSLRTLSFAGDTAILDLPDNMSLNVCRLFVNGTRMPDGIYANLQNATNLPDLLNLPNLRGSNVTVRVDARNFWLGGNGGNWSVPGNWEIGLPDDTLGASVLANDGESLKALVSGPATAMEMDICGLGSGVARVEVVDNGALVMTNCTGCVHVRDGGTLAFSGGASRVLIDGRATLDGRATACGISVESGGRLALSGGTLSVGISTNPTWTIVPALSQSGGVIDVSGSAQLLMDCGTYMGYDAPFQLFGTGLTTFRGASRLRHAPKTRYQHGPVFMPNAAGETSQLLFADSAAIGESGHFTGNAFIIGGMASATGRVTLASSATHYLGYQTLVGNGLGRGELIVKAGKALAQHCGLNVGFGYEKAGSTVWHSDGYVEVNGGELSVDADGNYTEFTTFLYGLSIGPGTAIVHDASGDPIPSTWQGEVAVRAGILRLGKATTLTIGSGMGVGVLSQSGGAIVQTAASGKKLPAIVGFVGGSGTWSMSGGTATIASSVYVGGVTTNELGVFVKGNTYGRTFPGDCHTAKGRLALTGGAMSVTGDLILSADGEGVLELGMGADLSVAGALDARDGAKLIVDTRGYTGEAKRLVTFGRGIVSNFDPANITLLKDAYSIYRVEIDETGIAVQPTGLFDDPSPLPIFIVYCQPPTLNSQLSTLQPFSPLVFARADCAASWADYLASFGLTLAGTFTDTPPQITDLGASGSRVISRQAEADACRVYVNASNETADLTFDVPEGVALTNDAVIAGAIRLVKTGQGRLKVKSENRYTGGTLWCDGDLEAYTDGAFGAADAPVTCQTTNEVWLYLRAAECRHSFCLANSATLNVRFAADAHVYGDFTDVADSSGALRLYQIDKNGVSYLHGSIVKTNATVCNNVHGDLYLTGSLVARALECDTSWGLPDWPDVPYESRETASKTRAGSGCLHLMSSNRIDQQAFFVYGSLAFEHENGLDAATAVAWRSDIYAPAVLNLVTNDQTIACLRGVSAGEKQIAADEPTMGLGRRRVASSSPVTLTLRNTAAAATSARLDDQVSLVYDPAENVTQSFVGNRRHRTSGTLTVKGGTLELGGETTWTNVPHISVSGGARLLVSSVAAMPLSTNVNITLESDAKISLSAGGTLNVGAVTKDWEAVQPGAYTTETCDWVEGENATVTVARTALRVWSKADYDAFTVEHPGPIVLAAGESIDFRYDASMTSVVSQVISGSGSVRISGSAGSILFAATNDYSGGTFVATTVRFAAPPGSGPIFVDSPETRLYLDCDAVPNGIVYRAPGVVFFNTAGTCSLAGDVVTAALPGAEPPAAIFLFPARTFTVDGDISAPNATVYIGANYESDHVYLNGKVTAHILSGTHGQTVNGAFQHFYGYLHLANPNNAVDIFGFSFIGRFVAETDHAYNTGAIFDWGVTGAYTYHADYELNGYSHDIGTIRTTSTSHGGCGTPSAAEVAGTELFKEDKHRIVNSASGKSVLTCRADESAWTWARFDGNIDFIYAPTAEYRLILSNRCHRISGGITVRAGTLRTGGFASFPLLKTLDIEAGASFELCTKVGWALDALERLSIADGATFKVESAEAILIGDGRLEVAEGGILALPAGSMLKVAHARVNGAELAPGDYTATAFIRGEGTLEVVGARFKPAPHVVRVAPAEHALADALADAIAFRSTNLGVAIRIELEPGEYNDTNGVTIASMLNLPRAPLSIVATDQDDPPRITSHCPVTGWTKGAGGVWSASLPDGLPAATLPLPFFCNGSRMQNARWPNVDPAHPLSSGFARAGADDATNALSVLSVAADDVARVRGWAHPDWGWVMACPRTNWQCNWYAITNAPHSETLRLRAISSFSGDAGTYNHDRYCVFNIREELDAPGEFCIDREGGRIHFVPPDGEDPNEDDTCLGAGEVALNIAASQGIVLEGLDVSRARGGIRASDCKNVTIRGCRLHDIGATGEPGISGYGHGIDIGDCDIWNIAGDGVNITGSVSGGRHPSDRDEIAICNNYIHHCGQTATDKNAIIFTAQGTVAHHNLIHDISRGAICAHARFFDVAYNRIRHVMLRSDDGGALYSYGWCVGVGSRYANNSVSDVIGYGYEQGTYLFRYGCTAVGIYLDGGSGGYDVTGNFVRNARLGMHFMHARFATVTNNIFVCNGDAIHAQCSVQTSCYDDPEAFAFDRNIVGAYRALIGYDSRWRDYPSLAQSPLGDETTLNPNGSLIRGLDIQRNIFHYPGQDASACYSAVCFDMSTNRIDCNVIWAGEGFPPTVRYGYGACQAFTRWQGDGMDVHSMIADPRFVNATDDDWRLLEDSPARELGFAELGFSDMGLTTSVYRTSLPVEAEGAREHPEWIAPCGFEAAERPVVGGAEVDHTNVFAYARVAHPIVYPSGPTVAGEVGHQTLAYGASTVAVPVHYTATLSNDCRTVLLRLNTNAAPTFADAEDGPAFEIAGGKMRLRLADTHPGLYYSLKSAAVPDGDWERDEGMGSGEGVVFETDLRSNEPCRFYRVYVSDEP